MKTIESMTRGALSVLRKADGTAAYAIREAQLVDAAALRSFKREALAETEFLLQGVEDYDDRLEAERDLVDRFQRDADCLLLLAMTPSGKVVGLCSIVCGHVRRTRHAGVVSVAVLRSCWRHGIATCMLDQAIRWARDCSDLHKLSLQVHGSNVGARRLYKALGFVEEGCLRAEAMVEDRFDDLVPMGLMLGDRGPVPVPQRR